MVGLLTLPDDALSSSKSACRGRGRLGRGGHLLPWSNPELFETMWVPIRLKV